MNSKASRRFSASAAVSMCLAMLSAEGSALAASASSAPVQVSATVIRPLQIERREDSHGKTRFEFRNLDAANVTIEASAIGGDRNGRASAPPAYNIPVIAVTIEY